MIKLPLKIVPRTLINYLAMLTLFVSGWVLAGSAAFELRISYVVMVPILLLWISMSRKISLNKVFLIIIFIVAVFSFYNVLLGNVATLSVGKQIFGIVLNAVVFYCLFKFNGFNVGKLFRVYLKLAFFVAVIGLFQEICYLIHFTPGYDYSSIIPGWRLATSYIGPFMRVNSIMREPTGLSVLLMPAFFCSIACLLRINNMFLSKLKSIVIITAVLLTFSATAIIGISILVVLFLVNLKNYKFLIVSALLFLVLLPIVYNNVGDIKRKVDDTIVLVTGRQTLMLGAFGVNLSTFALASNAVVAYNSFRNSPFIGHGLGSHELSYDRQIAGLLPEGGEIRKVSQQDANSLFLRLLSETGLFGVLLTAFFLIRLYVSKQIDPYNYLWIINNGTLVLLLLRLVRVGHYFEEGLFFFFWLYYFSKKNLLSQRPPAVLEGQT